MIQHRVKWYIAVVISFVLLLFGIIGVHAESKDLICDTIYNNTAKDSELVLAIQKWQNSDVFDNGFVQGEDGIYSVRMDLRKSGTYDAGAYEVMQFANNKRIDVSNIVETGELRFKLMLEADSESTTAENATMWFKNWNDSNPAWCDSARVSLPNAADIKADGKWYDVKIPLSSFKPSGAFDWTKLASIAMLPNSTMETKYNFYFRDIAIYNIVQSPELSFVNCEMNKNGMLVVHTKLSDDPKADTITADKFSVNGINAKNVTVNGREIDIIFDTNVRFPSEVRMNIESGIESVYGLGIETNYLDFVTPVVQDAIYIEHMGTPKLNDDTISLQIILKALCSEDDGLQSATALMAVYDEDKIVTTSVIASDRMKRGETKKIDAVASLPAGITLKEPRVEIYFYDSFESRKPIAEMKNLSMQ